MNKKVVTARDVMENSFLELDGKATVSQALEEMKQNSADVVIVRKRHDHDADGIVLLSDIAKKVLAKNHSPDRINLYEIMSKPLVGIEPGLDIRYCARLFDRFGISVAPVRENDSVIGVVSYRELVLKGLLE
jgi:CBS domain-containing protein